MGPLGHQNPALETFVCRCWMPSDVVPRVSIVLCGKASDDVSWAKDAFRSRKEVSLSVYLQQEPPLENGQQSSPDNLQQEPSVSHRLRGKNPPPCGVIIL